MRISGGEFRGRLLDAPKGNAVRPTSDRVRQAIFNILQSGRWRQDGDPELAGSSVIDLFCGTGALGLEAISRGAESCLFVDKDRTSLAYAKVNAAQLDLGDRAVFLLREAGKIGARGAGQAAADYVFLDPPYRMNLTAPALKALADGGWLARPSLLLVETEARPGDEAELESLPFTTIESRPYGDTLIRILRHTG